jgi:2,4-dienoyl-CoA reductase-like NADH-dependent reductase (Old Yellow Enzyme family)/thioredoxin reductase
MDEERNNIMGNYDHVLSPFTFGPVTVKNRIELSPACYMLTTPDGFVTTEMVDYYENMARGGAAIVTIGESPIDFKFAKGHEFQLNLSDRRVINGLSRITEAVHRFGSKLSIEIHHPGRFVLNGNDTIAPSPIVAATEEIAARKAGRKRIKVTEMDQDMIDEVIEHFATAALHCKLANFEMIMIHGAHGHLISQFLSPHVNKRRDAYGGSLENRAKFAIETLEAIRKKVGYGMGIEYRISADELTPDGMRAEETIEFVKMIEDKIDLLHVSAGLLGNPKVVPFMIQPAYLPHGYNVHYAEQFKKALKVPVATVGSILTMEEAEDIIAAGKADIVAMARAILADPQIVNNARKNRTEDTRPCMRCHTCNRLTAAFYPIRCAGNPVLGRETKYAKIGRADIKKKVAIIGGGPAGMQAAITASLRGHEVALFEKEKELGGNMRLAASLPIKADLRRFYEWIIRQTMKAPGVTVKLGEAATPDLIKAENPDALIIAVGSNPVIPKIQGQETNNVVWVGDVDVGKAKIGGKVVIIGAGATGCETGLQLAKDGKNVAMVDMMDADLVVPTLPRGLTDQLEEHRVNVYYNHKLDSITAEGAVIEDRNWNKKLIPADTVILSLGFRPRSALVSQFIDLVPDTFVAGDCRKAQTIKEAVHDGFNSAVEL